MENDQKTRITNQGSDNRPPSTASKVWSLAWPMMISSMSVPLLGLVDTALLGHLSSAVYLGAVAIGANLVGLAYWSFGFLRMGTTGLVAQNAGAVSMDRDSDETGIMLRSLALALLLGGAVAIVIPHFTSVFVDLMNASAEVAPLAVEYMDIRLYSAPAVFLTYVISGWLIGHQRVKSALLVVLVTNITNILLDALFIVGFGWNSAGAARATLLAEYLGFALAASLLLRHLPLPEYWRGHNWLQLGRLGSLLNANMHLMMRTLLLLFVLNFFTAQGARLGDNVLAANAILLQLALLSAYVMDGFCHAAEALCGREFGAGRMALFRHYARVCGQWIAGTALLFTLIYAAAGYWVVGWFSDLPAVSAVAREYLAWLCLVPLTGFAAYLMDGVFIGAGKTRAMNYSMMFSALVIFLPVWWLTLDWQNNGLWLAFILFNLARGVTLSGSYWFFWVRGQTAAK